MKSGVSYDYSILLTKAYRILRNQAYAALTDYDLIPTHWSLIGLVYSAKTGITLSEAADIIGVKLPLVTIMVDLLVKKDIIHRIPNAADGRSKLLVPTKPGAVIVKDIERQLSQSMSPLLSEVSESDMISFKKVLQTIIDNEK